VRLGLPEGKDKQEYEVSASKEITLYLHHSLEEVKPAAWEIDLKTVLFFKRLVLRNVLE
jgi:hypothetical protein